jgi:predicted nucleic acid-binding protein
MCYLDTSYIVKCYLNEPGSSEVLDWLEGKSGLCCSLHGRLELWNAVNRHYREGRLDSKQNNIVFNSIKTDEDSLIWTWLPITKEIIVIACNTVKAISGPPFLRSADALHLASAAGNGFKSVYSHDKIMLEYAKCFGLKGFDIIDI